MTTQGNTSFDTFLSLQWQAAVHAALARNAGELMAGLVHNLHNYAHTFSLQMDMWNNALQRNPNASISSQQRSLQRMTALSSDFNQECSVLGQRTFYTCLQPTSFQLSSALHWLESFWQHDLFFKHRVQLNINMGAHALNSLTIRPGLLIYGLEEGIKNGVESLNGEEEGQKVFQFDLDVIANSSSIRFTLRSPTVLDQSIDPWQAGTSTKTDHLGLGLPLLQIVCRKMGWNCQLRGDDQGTNLVLAVPL
ncbi:MAG: hypothetical protein ACLFRE_07035 [Desulfovermiculus sp.]